MKSEPDEVSFDDVLAAPGQTVAWFGVRNYQARNFMRDAMQVGDGILFYHSSCAVPGVAGIARSGRAARIRTPANSTAPANTSTRKPRRNNRAGYRSTSRRKKRGAICRCPKCDRIPHLEDMVLLQKGSRLSISPVTGGQWDADPRHCIRCKG